MNRTAINKPNTPYSLYCLHSILGSAYYVGITYDFIRRLEQHLKGTTIATKQYKDWKLYSIVWNVGDYSWASKCERYCHKNKIYKVENIINYMNEIHELENTSFESKTQKLREIRAKEENLKITASYVDRKFDTRTKWS